MLEEKLPRKKKCKECRETFQPTRSIQPCCGFKCALVYATNHAKKKAADRSLQEVKRIKQDAREARKAKREYIENDRGHQTKLTQDVFNAWIRFRDDCEPCISCGAKSIAGGIGGAWDCGHFLSRGARPELRFESLNAYKQCKKCNGGSGKYANKASTVAQEYERRLVIKIGQDKVDWLKGPHEPKKYTCDQLREIRSYYARLIREVVKDDADRPHK